MLGPINTFFSNRVEGLELTLHRAFPMSLKVVDADSGQPIAEASLSCQFWVSQQGCSFGTVSKLLTDSNGRASLAHCGPVPLVVTLSKPGYETTQRRLDRPKPGDSLTIFTRRALPVSGVVKDRDSGEPVRGAAVYVLSAQEAPGVSTSQADEPRPSAGDQRWPGPV